MAEKQYNINSFQISKNVNNNADDYMKYYVIYNDSLKTDKNSAVDFLDEFYSNLINTNSNDRIAKKIEELGVNISQKPWNSSLKIGTFDLGQYSKCDKNKDCALNGINEKDIGKLFYYPFRSNLNENEELEYERNKMNDKQNFKYMFDKMDHEQDSEWEQVNKEKQKINNEKIAKLDYLKPSGEIIFKNSECHQHVTKKDNIDYKSINFTFKTARDELSLQNSMKYGHSSKENYSYGNSKKTLGTRRTPRSEFVPPLKKEIVDKENDVKDTGNNQNNFIDDRLANIDPKMIELINNEIINNLEETTWNDIAGLEYAKSVIQEAIIWPILRPDLFTGIRRPPKGILFFGPPGTGKTLIGKCIASQSKSKFFSISASSLTSKWIGEGEKMVRALFAVAAVNQPSVIFIDEIDSLLCQRSESEHESSRRLKTEFLIQLDGAATSTKDRILIIGATNRPQELDDAARRRFVRRLYIPLPDEQARSQILENLLRNIENTLSKSDFDIISKITENYSGADMASLCQEASMEPLRAIPANEMLHFNKNNIRPVYLKDFEASIKKIRPSVSVNDLSQYLEWDNLYGSGCA